MHPDNNTIILTNTSTMVELLCEAEGALSYEWQTRSGKSLTGVTGWNTNNLTLYNVSMNDNDDYQCVATNASGSSFSRYATLDINGMYVCIMVHCICTNDFCVIAYQCARDCLSRINCMDTIKCSL